MAKKQTGSVGLWPLEKLKSYSNNPGTHSEAQIVQIAESIEEFGFTNPILVDTKAGILAGHGRLRAAQKLGLAKVPVKRVSFLFHSLFGTCLRKDPTRPSHPALMNGVLNPCHVQTKDRPNSTLAVKSPQRIQELERIFDRKTNVSKRQR